MYLLIDNEILELIEYFNSFSDNTLYDMFSNSSIIQEFIDTLYNNLSEEENNISIDFSSLANSIEKIHEELYYNSNYDDIDEIIDIVRNVSNIIDENKIINDY